MAVTPGGDGCGGGIAGGFVLVASPLVLLILSVTATGPTGLVSAAAAVVATGGECYVCGPQSGLLAPDAPPQAHDMKAAAAAPVTATVAAAAAHGDHKTEAEILPCAGFHESDARYRRRCEPFMGCIREEDGEGREARTCGNADGDVCYLVNNITYCYCKKPLCNTRTRMAVGPVSASAMAAPPPADERGASPPPDDEDASFEHSGGGPPPKASAPASPAPPRAGTSAAPPPPQPAPPPVVSQPPHHSTSSGGVRGASGATLSSLVVILLLALLATSVRL